MPELRYITAIRMDGEDGEEHISMLCHLDPSDGKTYSEAPSKLANRIDAGSRIYKVGSRAGAVEVAAVHRTGKPDNVRNVANRKRADNLLGLPRF